MSTAILIIAIFAMVFYIGAVILFFVRKSYTKYFELVGLALLATMTILAMCNNFSLQQAPMIMLLITLVCVIILRVFSLVKVQVSVKSSSSRKSSKK